MFAMFSGNESKFNYEVQTQDKHNYTVHPIQTQQSDKKKIKCHEPIANYKHNQMCRSETPIFKIYLLFIASFVCSCAVSLSLFVYTQRNMQLNDSSSSEFITRNEIDEIVQHLLSNVQNSDEVRLYVHSNKNHLEHEQLSPERTSPHGYDDGDVDKRYKAYPYIPPERKLSPMLSKMRERRAANILGENSIADTQQNVQGPSVEFFNPKMRRELEKKDEEIKRSTGKGSAPGGDDWAYLTSYSRIPYEAIAGFCQSTKEYCPPGPPGPPGHGVKGYRGDIGMPGPQGREGPIGPRGPKGTPGSPGLDGRDGIPGEPGLDGIPGRAGADGIPGKDGRDGTPGSNGKNGIDGKDGREGLPGPQGPPGAQGERGLTGPRGRSGKPGLNGTPGQPGITAYKYSTEPGKLLIPPTIAGVPIRPIVVVEDSFLRLRCAASGQPKPDIVWSRLDGRPITDGAWQDSSIRMHTLNITHVNRVHNGVYICMAINGVPPAANATFQIEVHFAPLIRVRNQHLYAFEGGSVSLECETEAFPEPLKYWKRRSDNRILDQNDKFRMETITDGYKSSMRLNITDVRPEDFGEYECVSKNEINTTAATFFVYDGSRHPTRTYSEIAVFGTLPPKPISYTEFCPPPNCPQPNCDEHRCNNAYIHQNIEIHQLHFKGLRFPGITNRTFDCVLYAVGKPVYHKSTNITYGSWLKDSRPRTKELSEKIWTTYETDPTTVYEFTDKTSFRNNQATKQRLKLPGFQGNAHVVFNGSFYYHQKDSAVIVRYDLEKRETICNVSLPEFQWNGGHYLYTTMCNYVDLNADENGLWAIYSTPKTSNTYVVKLDAITLEVQYGWNITLNHNKVGEMFIVCGVLYAIDSVTERNTKILLALDLYRGHALNDVNLSFTNPFKNTTMAVYNPETKELFTWDHGNQLTYPIRYNEMTKYDSASERVAEAYIETGYDSQ